MNLKAFKLKVGKQEDGRIRSERNSTFTAVYNDTAFSGIGIIRIERGIDDKVICQKFAGDKRGLITQNAIVYEISGRAYIKKYGKKYYLDEFIKV